MMKAVSSILHLRAGKLNSLPMVLLLKQMHRFNARLLSHLTSFCCFLNTDKITVNVTQETVKLFWERIKQEESISRHPTERCTVEYFRSHTPCAPCAMEGQTHRKMHQQRRWERPTWIYAVAVEGKESWQDSSAVGVLTAKDHCSISRTGVCGANYPGPHACSADTSLAKSSQT